jgi:YidC/Oxa1 family membrane protein insertase
MVRVLGSIWQAGSDLMLATLNFFYGITHSYGLSIILLTIVVRLLLHPLTHKQLVSMRKMQQIQPRLRTLQEKYGDDKAKLNQELMKLYKDEGINPAAGCLPMLLQLPIMILLFRLLMTYDFGNISFMGVSLAGSVLSTMAAALGIPAEKIGITMVLSAIASNPVGLLNVSVYAGNLLLLIGITVLTWLQQKFSGSTGNPQMAFMNWFMPLFLAFICLSLPGGVLLYWGVSSLIGVAQQWWVQRTVKVQLQEKPVLYKNKPPTA